MTLIVQISDPHFGTERAEVVDALRTSIKALHPALVILSGDVTQRARHAQFAAARQFIDTLERPWLAIPGNHDVPLFNLLARSFDPFGGYRRAFGDDLEPTFSSTQLLAIGVNTVRATRHKNGEVSDAQIERVSERLRGANREQLRIVVTHQPVHVIREKDIANLLIHHERAIAAWAEAGADLVLGGHIHLPYVRPLATETRRLARPLWSVQAGTAVSSRIREGISNSFHAIRHEPDHDRVTVEQWDYDEGRRQFTAGQMTTISLQR